ncbi:MAG: hypothetical protein KDJ87_22485 [Rhizobiaceae bacterium]|nr:hypothetical protein [Rhizobiaceae bacterium]
MTQSVRQPEPADKDRKSGKDLPPAGPHARESLTDYDKTPGTGSLPGKDRKEADVGPD